jgi:peptidoglycan pentaglycine glycine transferase (the first glycine)
VKFVPSCSYDRIDQGALGGGAAVAWISREPEDTCWDKFLQETPLGQFQQSTIWAQAKRAGGWKAVRVLVTMEDEIVAGFQILWRSSWRGRMGYVSKGPVVLPGYSGLAEYAAALLQRMAQKERLRALVVQPPDWCVQTSEPLACSGFMPNMLAQVNDATWTIDLRGGFEAVERRMAGEARRKIRQAINRGLTIREGGRKDIETFFELMLSSCRRQGVAPNPPDVHHLFALWDAAYPAGCIRLFFAEYEGKPLTGYLDIAFGKTLTQWKKGWTSTESQRNPNDLITYEALTWANRNGYQFYDFSAFDREMGIAMLNGEPLTAEQERSRYVFFTRFGGSPRLLSEARVYFPNPLIRSAYRVFFSKKIRQAEKDCELTRALVGNSGLNLADGRTPFRCVAASQKTEPRPANGSM